MQSVYVHRNEYLDTTSQRKPLVWLPLVLGAILLVFVPVASQVSNPPHIHPSFLYCAGGDVLLAIWGIWLLRRVPSRNAVRRIPVYLTLLLAFFIALTLANAQTEKYHFDFWARLGVHFA